MKKYTIIVSFSIAILIFISNICLADTPRVARAFRASALIENIETALELLKKDTGVYPTNEQGLQLLIERPPNSTTWKGPFGNLKEMS